MGVPFSHSPHSHTDSIPDPTYSYYGILPPQMTAGSAFPRTRGLHLACVAPWSSAPGQRWEQKMRSARWPCRHLAVGVRGNRKHTRQIPSNFQRHTPWKGGGFVNTHPQLETKLSQKDLFTSMSQRLTFDKVSAALLLSTLFSLFKVTSSHSLGAA